MQDNTSTSTSSTELYVSNDGASTSTSMITSCTANLNSSLSTIGYTEDEDFDDLNSITGKGKSSNGVLFMDNMLPNLPFVSSEILLLEKESMISTCIANSNLSSSTKGYTEVECCLIDLDFDDGDDVN